MRLAITASKPIDTACVAPSRSLTLVENSHAELRCLAMRYIQWLRSRARCVLRQYVIIHAHTHTNILRTQGLRHYPAQRRCRFVLRSLTHANVTHALLFG